MKSSTLGKGTEETVEEGITGGQWVSTSYKKHKRSLNNTEDRKAPNSMQEDGEGMKHLSIRILLDL